jgi:hypothetical protein
VQQDKTTSDNLLAYLESTARPLAQPLELSGLLVYRYTLVSPE